MAQINKPNTYFNTVTWTGNSSTQAITGVGFQPDFIWKKSRSQAYSHRLSDSVRGGSKVLNTDNTNAEGTDVNEVISFDSDGFTLGNSYSNFTGHTHVGWSWKAGGTAVSNTDGSITSSVSANTTSGFSIVSFNGGGSGSDNIGHGLGSTPKIVLIKDRDGATDWLWYTTAIDGSYDTLRLNTTGAKTDSSYTAPTSLVFSFPANSANDYIAYCFAEKKGFSKFGSYTGNGSTDGTFVYTGFKPAFVISKQSSGSLENWSIADNKRDSDNVVISRLFPDLSNAESTNLNLYDFTSNGFKIRNSDNLVNASGSTYIYMAFAENPLVGTNNIPATAR